MDLQIALGEPAKLIQQQSGPRIDQQTAAQLRLGGMDGNEQGRKPLFLYPLPISGGEVGEC